MTLRHGLFLLWLMASSFWFVANFFGYGFMDGSLANYATGYIVAGLVMLVPASLLGLGILFVQAIGWIGHGFSTHSRHPFHHAS